MQVPKKMKSITRSDGKIKRRLMYLKGRWRRLKLKVAQAKVSKVMREFGKQVNYILVKKVQL
jgi:hypothetical protein